MKRADVIWMGVLALAFALLVGPLLATGRSGKSEMSDEVKYHLPVIVTFASELPRPDLKHYRVAMTPAWHLTMATMYRLLGGDLVAIRVLNAVFGLAVVLLIYGMARQFVAGPLAAALAAPVLASNYLIGASSALTTDNAAWAGALATLWCAVLLRPTVMSVVLAGVGATWTVLVRQVFIWLVAPIVLVALCATPLAKFVPTLLRPDIEGDRRKILVAAALGVAAATGAVAAFLLIWGGLVPDHPEMTSHFERGFNGASFAFAFTLAGMSGVCLLPLAWEQVRRLRIADVGLWIWLLAGLASSIAFETAWRSLWRSLGLVWHVVEAVGKLSGGQAEQIDGQLQMIGAWSDPLPGRNGLFVLTAPFGALVLCVLFRGARNTGHGRQAAVLLLTTLGFVLTQSFNIVVAQRYFEPVILSVVLVLGAMATAAECADGVHRRWPRFAGPLTLAAVQLCLTAATTYREAFVP